MVRLEVPTLGLEISRKAAEAAREHGEATGRGTKDACFLRSCWLGAPGEPPPRSLRATSAGRRARPRLLTAQLRRRREQPPAGKGRGETSGSCWLRQPGWRRNEDQRNQGGEQNQNDQSDQCKIENALCFYHCVRLFNVRCIFPGYVYAPGHLLVQLFPPEEKDKGLVFLFF